MLRFKLAMVKKCITYATIFIVAMSFSTKAHAEGFSLYDWSARGAALAGGLVARGGDASVVAYNPAAMSKLEGTQIMLGSEFVIPAGSMTFYGEPDGGSGGLFVIPTLYATHKLNDSFSFGLGVFSRFGMGADHEDDWNGRYNIVEVDLQAFTINPNVAYSFNEEFSLALGIELTTASAIWKQAIPTMGTPATDGRFDLNGDTFGVGFNIGAHYKFSDEWSAGLAYRSRMNLEFSGDANLSTPALPAVPPFFPGEPATNLTSKGSINLRFPDQISLGVAWQLIPELSLGADVSYYVWSTFDKLEMSFDNSQVPDVSITKNWKRYCLSCFEC